jgi:hypothetical protein
MISKWGPMQLHTPTAGCPTTRVFNEVGDSLHGFMICYYDRKAINIVLSWRLLSCLIHSTTTCSQMTLECQHCNQEITFDDYHISSKSGKKISLNPTGEPHRCEEGLRAWRAKQPKKLYTCQYCNEVKIYFDSDYVTESGKYIPLDALGGGPHDCPARSRKRGLGYGT